jgi:hypothetical protein
MASETSFTTTASPNGRGVSATTDMQRVLCPTVGPLWHCHECVDAANVIERTFVETLATNTCRRVPRRLLTSQLTEVTSGS